MITFFVPGIPKPQPRPRAFARKFGNKWAARVYDAGTAENWKSQIAIAARPHLPKQPITGPIELGIRFYMPRPKSHFRTGRHATELRADAPRYHFAKPDRDNLSKGTCDALTQLGAWQDDGQVCAGPVEKFYAEQGRATGAEITIRPLSQTSEKQGELLNG